MSNIVISIIIPIYNAYPYCIRLMDSIFKHQNDETIRQIEVIAIDDGSTDESASFLDSIATEHRNMTVVHQANTGMPSIPRNRAIEMAKGDYVFFADADDWFYPDAITRMIQYVNDNDIDVGVFYVDGREWEQDYQGLYEKSQKHCTFYNSKISNSFGPWKLFKKDLLMKYSIRFPERGFYEDQPFTVEAMLRADRIDIIADRPYYYYVRRADENQLSLNLSSFSLDHMTIGLLNYFNKLIEITSPQEHPMLYSRGIRYCFKDKVIYNASKQEDQSNINKLVKTFKQFDCNEVRRLLPLTMLVRYDALLKYGVPTFLEIYNASKYGIDMELYQSNIGQIDYTFSYGNKGKTYKGKLPSNLDDALDICNPKIKKTELHSAEIVNGNIVLSGRTIFLRHVGGDKPSVECNLIIEGKNGIHKFPADIRGIEMQNSYANVINFKINWSGEIPIKEMAQIDQGHKTFIQPKLEIIAGGIMIVEDVGKDRKSGIFAKWIRGAYATNGMLYCPTETKTKNLAINAVPISDVESSKTLIDFDQESGNLILMCNMGFDNYPSTKMKLVCDGNEVEDLIKWGTRGNRTVVAVMPIATQEKGEHSYHIEAIVEGNTIRYSNYSINKETNNNHARYQFDDRIIVMDTSQEVRLSIASQ